MNSNPNVSGKNIPNVPVEPLKASPFARAAALVVGVGLAAIQFSAPHYFKDQYSRATEYFGLDKNPPASLVRQFLSLRTENMISCLDAYMAGRYEAGHNYSVVKGLRCAEEKSGSMDSRQIAQRKTERLEYVSRRMGSDTFYFVDDKNAPKDVMHLPFAQPTGITITESSDDLRGESLEVRVGVNGETTLLKDDNWFFWMSPNTRTYWPVDNFDRMGNRIDGEGNGPDLMLIPAEDIYLIKAARTMRDRVMSEFAKAGL